MIYKFRKESDAHTTYNINLPEGGQELATLEDGNSYAYVPDGAQMPPQPEQIGLEPVELTAELRERIKAASPLCRLIHRRMQEQIRARYPVDEELFLARISVGALMGTYQPSAAEQAGLAEYQAFVEGVREWGREERAKVGV
jgi:hypothetical protein